MDLTQINEITLPVVLAAIVQGIKMTGLVRGNFIPLLSIVLGAAGGILFLGDLVQGVISGLVASWLYEVTFKSGKEAVRIITKK